LTDILQLVSAVGLFVAITIIVVLTAVKTAQDMRAKKAGLKVDDERTRQVKGQAALYSWVVGVEFTTGFVLVLLVGSQFPWFPSISAMLALAASLLVSVASFLLLQWHLNRMESLR
jgi:preprotein translocase subunit SecF